jgi:S1-C subfamily serine protease
MAKNWCTIEWKVFDKALNKVVLTDVSRGEFEGKYTSVSELNTMMDLFQDALENFLLDGKLYEVVKNAGASAPFGNANAGTDAPNMRLSLVPIPQFGSSSEMIQFASHACVTVQTPGLLASGVMISESGLMVTVADIAATGSLATVVLSNGTELETKLLVKDEESNLALFQVLGSKFKALPLGKGLTAGLGEEVVTIGTPLKVELGQSVTKGILSGKRQQGNLTVLQTDLTLSPGNGGGPIINQEGRVIGIINSRIEGFGFAVPIETVLKRLGLEAGE